MKIQRTMLQYPGNKYSAYRHLIKDYMPSHGTYIEPFGGAAGVLMQKAPAQIEIYNDIDGQVVNFMRVLKDKDKFEELAHRLRYTPYCKSEFETAYEIASDANDVTLAWATFVKSWMGFRMNAIHDLKAQGWKKTGLKDGCLSTDHKSGKSNAKMFADIVDMLPVFAERLRRVEIWQVDAMELIKRYRDMDRVLFYLDPPYPNKVLETKFYTHDMDTVQEHSDLAEQLLNAKAMALLSGYRCELYDELYADWQRIDYKVYTQNSNARTESLWINDAAQAALQKQSQASQTLFGED